MIAARHAASALVASAMAGADDGVDGIAIGKRRTTAVARTLEVCRHGRVRRHELAPPQLDGIAPRLGADEVFTGRAACRCGITSRLLRGPVRGFGGLDRRAAGLLLAAVRFERGLGRRGGPTRLAEVGSEGTLAASVRLGDEPSHAPAEAAVLLLVLRLQREPAHLWLELGDEVGDPDEVVGRLRESRESLVLPHLQRLDAGGLLEQLAPLLGAQGQRGIHGSLPDDDERIGAELTGTRAGPRCRAAARATPLIRYSLSPDRYARRPIDTSAKSIGSCPSALSSVRIASAMPCGRRACEPAKMTSSARRVRR